jgi:hypothetical protein
MARKRNFKIAKAELDEIILLLEWARSIFSTGVQDGESAWLDRYNALRPELLVEQEED